MEQLTYERLQENLKRLKLDRAAEILDTVAEHAEKNKTSYMAFLDHLLEVLRLHNPGGSDQF